MNNAVNNILMIAGEMSGDLHGSAVISELKMMNPVVNIIGIGGERMKSAGMEIIYHLDRLAFLGFSEVVKHIPFIKKVQREIILVVKERNIRLAVLIDYPGFNLSIAKRLKQQGVYIIYYISPQIWAWGAGRITKIKRMIDKMVVLFPFELDLYKKNKVDVEFVGHPLIERVSSYKLMERESFCTKFGLDKNKDILLILPGSRKHEVEMIFPEAIKGAEKLAQEFNLQVVTACSENLDEKLISSLTEIKDLKIIKGFNYDLMNLARFGIIKSGTSTLEAGIFELPMVIVYRTSRLTYLIGKSLIKLKNIGMVNIILGKKTVPELIQDDAGADNIYNECRKYLENDGYYSSVKRNLSMLKEKLGNTGASRRAAEIINKALNEI